MNLVTRTAGILAMTGFLIGTAGLDAHAQLQKASQHGPPSRTPPDGPPFGVPHRPIGQARLAYSNGAVEVLDLQSSGLGGDGVAIDLGNDFTRFHALLEAAPNAPHGAVLQASSYGRLAGNQTLPIASTWITRRNDTEWPVRVDFSPLGVDSYTLEVIHDGEITYHEQIDATAGAVPVWPFIVAAAYLIACVDYEHETKTEYDEDGNPVGNKTVTETWSIDCPFPFSVQVNPNESVPGDHIRFRAQVPAELELESCAGIRLQAGDVDSFKILQEETARQVGAVDLERIPGSRFDYAKGDLRVSAASGDRGPAGLIANLGRADLFGLNGLSFDDLGPAPSFEVVAGGSITGGPSQVFGTFLIDEAGNELRAQADFSTLGSTSQTVEVYYQGALVASAPGHTGIAARWPGDQWPPGTCVFFPSLGLCWYVPFPGPVLITVPGPSGFTVTGDEIRMIAEGGTPIDSFDYVAVTSSDIGSFSLSSTALENPAATPHAYSKQYGQILSGDVASLVASDDNSLVVQGQWRPQIEIGIPPYFPEATPSTSHASQITVSSSVELGDFSELTVDLESGGESTQVIEIFDFVAESWELVDSRSIPATESNRSFELDDAPGRFRENGSGLVRLRLSWFGGSQLVSQVDHVTLEARR